MNTQWDTFYIDLCLEAGNQFKIPKSIEERAIYVLKGEIDIEGVRYQPEQMLILHPHDEVVVSAASSVHVMVLGGATMDGSRHIFWNFVSSSKERLEQAKEDWRAGKFDKVPGDSEEFIPLP